MTPKFMLSTVLLLTGLFANAQLQAATGKLFIINNSSRTALTNALNPAATLSQTDRVELTSIDPANASISVKRCGALGCLDPVGQTVRLEVVNQVNAAVSAQNLSDDGECRVCRNTKTISTNLDSYVNQIKASAP